MPPVTAASLLVIPSFVTNFWQLFAGPNFIALMSGLWLMMLGNSDWHRRRLMAPDERQHRMVDRWTGRRAGALCWIQPSGATIVCPGAYGTLGIARRRSDDRVGHGSNRGFRHSRRSLSSGARPEQGRSDPGAWAIVHDLDNSACGGTSQPRSIPSWSHCSFCTCGCACSARHVVRAVDPSAYQRRNLSPLVPDLPCPSRSRTHYSAISLMHAMPRAITQMTRTVNPSFWRPPPPSRGVLTRSGFLEQIASARCAARRRPTYPQRHLLDLELGAPWRDLPEDRGRACGATACGRGNPARSRRPLCRGFDCLGQSGGAAPHRSPS
jgi:hypothetical protein